MWISYFGPLSVFGVTMGKNLIMKNTDRWMKNWILKYALQLWKVHSAIVELHNQVVAEAMEKTTDEKCEPEISRAGAISAKNALRNHLEHSPNELVLSLI